MTSKKVTIVQPEPVQKKRQAEDSSLDFEQQFVLRMPPGPAMALARDIELGSTLKDNLFIDVLPDQRWGSVRYGGQVFTAKMVDLPCIMESLKTTDGKTFYKTADICQMLICSQDMEPSDDELDIPKKKKDREKKYKYNHGLCPPLKNVRKRRFRKTLEKKQIDIADIEKEVKRLFRMDNEAINVKWEETTDDKPVGGESGSIGPSGSSGAGSKSSGLLNKDLAGKGSGADLAEQDIFGELSSSEDENDYEDEDKDVNILDSDEDSEAGRGDGDTSRNAFRGEEADGGGEDGESETEDGADAAAGGRIEEVLAELQELKGKIRLHRAQVAGIENPDLRQRFQAVLEELLEEEAEKQRQYEGLCAALT